jgi:hypothetical protein
MSFPPPVTLVTACYSLTKYNPSARSPEKSIESAIALLSVPCYLIIYCNAELYPIIKAYRDTHGLSSLTHYSVLELEDLWTYKWKDIIVANREKYWPTRDSRAGYESHIICCNKFDFVLKATQNNPFNTAKFAWIDGNIGPNGSKISEFYENNMVLYILNNIGQKFRIQILNVVDKKFALKEHKEEYYQHYRWLVCGCLFTLELNPTNVRILERLKDVFAMTTEAGYGHGEEMLYLEVLDEFYHDIDRAYGDYKHILHNFIEPVRGHDYIYNNIIKHYLQRGYHRECYDAARTLVSVYENYRTAIDYHLYVLALFDMYVASYYACRHESRYIVEKIRRLCAVNPYFKTEFDKNAHFYESQFQYLG